MQIKRLVIAGTHSGAGKTTISIGLMAALTGRGLRVQPFKIGPDFIDAAYHTLVTGQVSRNLDDWLLPPETLKHLFLKNTSAADIAIIEGVMGLYDGIGTGQEGSTAAVAKTLEAPVVLVIDAASMSTSAAAQVLGYQHFDRELPLRGVLLNNVSPGRHFELLKEAIEGTTGISVLGCLPPHEEIRLPSRHLGLVPATEMAGMQARIERLIQLINQCIDVEKLLALAADTSALANFSHPHNHLCPVSTRVNLAVAADQAFNFYYQDNLELLEELGANIYYFSPLQDSQIPAEADGLYLGGGFPEEFAAELAQNHPMIDSFKQRLKNGMPCFAESGGLMYLTDSIMNLQGKVQPMTGVLGGKARMTTRLQRFGYVDIHLSAPCILGQPGDVIRGNEFHHSLVEGIELPQAYDITNATNDGKWTCGYVSGNILAGYPHVHFWSNPRIAANFLTSCLEFKQRRPHCS